MKKILLSEIIYALIITIVFGAIFVLTEGVVKHKILSAEAFDTTPCDGVCLVELKCAEIYNDRLYTPGDFAAGKQEAPSPKADYEHYLTYRFFVNTVPGEAYGFFSKKSDYAMNVYADGVLIGAAGQVSDAPETFTPSAAGPTGTFTAESKKTEIVIQQANFNHVRHYNLAVMIGPTRDTQRYVNLFYISRTVMVICLMTAGLMNLGMYLFSDQKPRYLFLACLCFAGAVNYATPFLISFLFPNISWYLSHRIEYCSKILAILFGVAYTDMIFEYCLNKYLKRILFSYLAVGMAITVFLPSTVYTRISTALTYILVAGLCMGLCNLVVTMRRRHSKIERYKRLIVFGVAIVLVFALVELLGFSGKTNNAIKTETGIVVFVFINTVALALDFRETGRMLAETKLREEELLRTNETMVKLGKMRDTFVADLSHELKTPLTVIGNLAALSAYQLRNGLADEKTAKGLQKIENEAVRLGRMVDQLKQESVAGFENDGEKVKDLLATLRYAADFCEPLCRRNNNRLSVNCPEGVTADISEDLVFHCLYNLIANATRHCQNKVIELNGSADEEKTVIRVIDRGSGMTDDEKEKAFDRGYSGDEGSGIGLALCREIAEDNGGEIRLSDTPGGGLTVTIEFRR